MHVDIKNLFKLQRVNKTFERVMQESKDIQRKMFLLQSPQKDEKPLDKYMINPILATALGCTVFFATESPPSYVHLCCVVGNAKDIVRTMEGKDGSWQHTKVVSDFRSVDLALQMVDDGRGSDGERGELAKGATLRELKDVIQKLVQDDDGSRRCYVLDPKERRLEPVSYWH